MLKKRKHLFVLCGFFGFALLSKADYPGKLFELDGNSVNGNTCGKIPDTAPGCDDWDRLNGDGTGGAAGNSLARTFGWNRPG